MRGRWNWTAVAIAAPAVVLGAVLAVSLVLSVFGQSPIWPDHQLTLPEAIAVSDDAEIVRLMDAGQDLSIAYSVRPGVLFERPASLTPLEAAVQSHRADLVERLLASGARVDGVIWNRLRCLAGDDSVVAVLERHRPGGVAIRCDDISAP
jgi:hypothetical protein